MSVPDANARPVPRLPQLTTRDLNGIRRTLPNGRLNVLLIAHQRWQLLEADSWIPALDTLERAHEGVSYFELPVVAGTRSVGHRLHFVMRQDRADHRSRARTLAVPVDTAGFRDPLGVADEEHLAVVLVDGDGLVLWRGSGMHSASAEASLRAAIVAAAHPRVH
jgi:hypothetical protein